MSELTPEQFVLAHSPEPELCVVLHVSSILFERQSIGGRLGKFNQVSWSAKLENRDYMVVL